MKAGSIGATRGAICPGQATVPGGAVWLALLATPQLAANITVGGVGAVDELLSKDLLALSVQAVRGARQLPREGHGLLWGIQQAVPWDLDTKVYCIQMYWIILTVWSCCKL